MYSFTQYEEGELRPQPQAKTHDTLYTASKQRQMLRFSSGGIHLGSGAAAHTLFDAQNFPSAWYASPQTWTTLHLRGRAQQGDRLGPRHTAELRFYVGRGPGDARGHQAVRSGHRARLRFHRYLECRHGASVVGAPRRRGGVD